MMNAYEKPPPYSPPASGIPIPSGYPPIIQSPTPSDTQHIVYSGSTHYGSCYVPVTANAVGICPSCRIGSLEDEYPCSAICLALFCLPCCGICCCLAMKRRRCPYCGAVFQ